MCMELFMWKALETLHTNKSFNIVASKFMKLRWIVVGTRIDERNPVWDQNNIQYSIYNEFFQKFCRALYTTHTTSYQIHRQVKHILEKINNAGAIKYENLKN